MSIAYAPIILTLLDIDFRAGINGRPDNIIVTPIDSEDPIWIPVWDDAEFDIVDKLLARTIPEEGLTLSVRHRVNEEGYDDYRLSVDKRDAAKAARKRRAAIETAQAVAGAHPAPAAPAEAPAAPAEAPAAEAPAAEAPAAAE